MNTKPTPTYLERDRSVDPAEINALYTAVGWNKKGQRTLERTTRMLQESPYFVVAIHNARIIGFGRILADAYVAQIFDIIVSPDFRRQGVASVILQKILAFAEGKYLGISLIDGSGVEGLYEKAGFVAVNPDTDRLMYWQPDTTS